MWKWFIFMALAVSSEAATQCVRPSADVTFDGDGTTWAAASSGGAAGARKGLPAVLTRGDTYLCIKGAICTSNYTFDDVESGTTTIIIRRATIAAHGPATGWLDSMADSPTIFPGEMRFARDYYVIDGAVRNNADWRDTNSYGFKTEAVYIWPLNFAPGADHCSFAYMDVGGVQSSSYTAGNPVNGFYFVGNGSPIVTDITVSNCYIHNLNGASFRIETVDTVTIQACWFENNWNKEVIRGSGSCDNVFIRWNFLKNGCQDNPDDATANGCTAEIAIWDSTTTFDVIEIYGNIIFDTIAIDHSDANILVGGNGANWAGQPANNSKVYNNTIAGIQTGLRDIQVNGGTGNEARNNLFYDVVGTPSVNANTTSNNGEESSDPFVNYAGFDFHLTRAIAGTSLGSPYNIDAGGVTRGADGTFDRSAYDYVAGASITVLNSGKATIRGLGVSP